MLSEDPGTREPGPPLTKPRIIAGATRDGRKIFTWKHATNVQFPHVADDVSCNNYYQNYKQSKFPAPCLSHPVCSHHSQDTLINSIPRYEYL